MKNITKLSYNQVQSLLNVSYYNYPVNKNKWNALTKAFKLDFTATEFIQAIELEADKQISKFDQELMDELAIISLSLTPENLSCDGELDIDSQNDIAQDLYAQWRELELENNFILPPESYECKYI